VSGKKRKPDERGAATRQTQLKETISMQAKKNHQFAITIGAAMLLMLSCLSQGWAATSLNGPRGLALDAKGNLYVANQGSNQVLVYNANYAQQAKKTISAGVSQPVGVAFDSRGNMYVANKGSQSITQYSSTGVQNTSFSVTSGIDNPWAITVDAVDDLYVSNNFTNITVYALDNGAPLVKTMTPGYTVYGITVHGSQFYTGSVNEWTEGFVGELLTGGSPIYAGNAYEGLALTTDTAGDLYVANATGEVDFWGPGGGYAILVLGFGPEGIAVDSVRGRVYLSNQSGNQILVYNTSGTLLHTIQ
jgi:YVTN family beta-propeller protein